MKNTFKKLPIILSLLFVILFFFLLIPVANKSHALDYDCGTNVYTTSNCNNACVGTSKPLCIKQVGTYYKCCAIAVTTTTKPTYKCGPYPCAPSMMQCPDCCCSSYTAPNCGGTKINDYCCDCATTPTTTSPGGGNCSGSCSYNGKSGTCEIKASDGSGCPDGTFHATGECPGGSECICCVPNETYTCGASKECSSKYKYCRISPWTSTDENCSDTHNANYTVDCSCTTGSTDCQQAPNGVDTSSCDEEIYPGYNCINSKCERAKTPPQGEYQTKEDCEDVCGLICNDYDPTKDCGDCKTADPSDECTKNNKGSMYCTYTIYKDNNGKTTTDCLKKYNVLIKDSCTVECPSGETCSDNNECESSGSNPPSTTSSTSTTTTTYPGNTTITYPNNPTSTTASTTTTKPVSASLTFELGLDGIGVSGDEPNPQDTNCTPQQILDGCGSNQNPLRKSRTLNVDLYNSNSTNVIQKSGTIKFDSTSGTYKGTVDLGTFTTGTYTIKVKSPGYLRRLVNDNQTITSGQTNNTVFKRMATGNVNEDNLLNIEDYNIFLSCSEFSTDNKVACNSKSSYKTLSDLDDNGPINNYDYNLFMRELAVQQGD